MTDCGISLSLSGLLEFSEIEVWRTTLLWLILMLVADVIIALSTLLTTSRGGILGQTSAGQRGCLAATASSIIILTMWLVVHFENFEFLREWTASAFACTSAFFLLWIFLIGAVNLCLVYGLPVRKISLTSALSE